MKGSMNLLLKNLKRIDISNFKDEGVRLLNSAVIEGAYFSGEKQAFEVEIYDGREISASLLLGERGYKSICSACGSGLCSHVASLILCYLADADSFEEVDKVGASFKGVQFSKFLPNKKKVSGRGKDLSKKFQVILSGLDIAEELLLELVKLQSSGEPAILLKSIKIQANKLSEYFLPGIGLEIYKLLEFLVFQKPNGNYLGQLSRLHSLIKESKTQFSKACQEGGGFMPYSVCSTRCGHVWKYGELSSLCPPRDASLIQLNFSVHENLLAQRLEETGVWLDLESGEIHFTQNLRPFKALRYIPQSDSEYSVVHCKGLVEYPGEYNYRVNWSSDIKELSGPLVNGKAFGQAKEFDLLELRKIKKLLRDGHSGMPLYGLFKVSSFSVSSDDVSVVLGEYTLSLSMCAETEVLKCLPNEALKNTACLFRFTAAQEGIEVSPVCLISSKSITRLGL